MPKRKSKIEIGQRAFEEVGKIFNISKHGGMTTAAKTIGCSKKAIYGWENGNAPDAIYLQRLHDLGADVVYILTGVKKNG